MKCKQSCQNSEPVANQGPLISRTGTLPQDISLHFCIRRQQYHQYGCPSFPQPRSFLCHHSWRPLLCGVASALHRVPVPLRHDTFRRFDTPPT